MSPEQTFQQLTARCGADSDLSARLWHHIHKQYSAKKRHYHNFSHLEHILNELEQIKEQVNNWDVLLFSLFYHDIIYNPLRKDNEDKSAGFAVKALQSLHLPEDMIALCHRQIMATKSHTMEEDNDSNFFTDADLSILGSTPEIYKGYSIAIRKEYTVYPDLLYKPGRKKVLQHFLQMKRIFKTDHFYKRYELQARKNLQMELRMNN